MEWARRAIVSVKWILFFLIGIGFGVTQSAFASHELSVIQAMKTQYPGVSSEMLLEPIGSIQWVSETRPAPSEKISTAQIRIDSEVSPGEIEFHSGDYSGVLRFRAYLPARVATRRIVPGEPLREDFFRTQNVEVTRGMMREIRGVFLSQSRSLKGLLSRQTILEGAPLLSSSVQRAYDIKRGDAVRIELIGNGLRVSVGGTADESGYLDDTVHVTAHRTKQRMVGKLSGPGSVEVQL